MRRILMLPSRRIRVLPLRRSRRGSTFVEATMVLPLLILSVLTCVLISMFFYDTTIRQCRMHESLRCEAGEITERTTTLTRPEYDSDELTVSYDNVLQDGVFRKVSGTSHTEMLRRLLLFRRGTADLESASHACDGVVYIRYFTLVKNGIKSKSE